MKKILTYLRHLITIGQGIEFLKNEIWQEKLIRLNDLKGTNQFTAKVLIELYRQKNNIASLSEVEFKVFSQFGDDGIIQYLINKIQLPNKTFVEFGVENYRESNTRFLLINNNWSGLVMDGSESNINYIKNDVVSWSNELFAKQAFITKENVNELLSNLPFGQELGILSVDIDGNDYWIWKEINTVNPVIVICEYNSVFGKDKPWTIPYNPSFVRPSINTDPVFTFYGTSLLSLCDLAEEKGYFFIGCNSAGNNSYFIRKDKIGELKPISCSEGYVRSKFRESFDAKGDRASSDQLRGNLKGQQVYNTRENITELFS